MTQEVIHLTQDRMQKAITNFLADLGKLRGGRAHPCLIDHIRIDYYGNATPLSQISNIANEDNRTLLVTVWDQSAVDKVAKAISSSNLGINPNIAGQVIRLIFPPLTEQRRKDLVRMVRDKAEQVCVSVRHIRRDANQSIKNLLKDKQITEDEEHRAQAEVQKLTDNYIAEIDKLVVKKERDLMAL